MPKVSIIVPIYKAESNLHRCIDCILAQTLTDWELLLVDDGSPDKSGEICDSYAAQDERIHVFHTKNGGVSSARQKGQDAAVGEFTIHVDPDDWIEPTMLSELYAKAIMENSDMVICDYYADYGNKKKRIKQRPSRNDSFTVLHELFLQLHGSCCNKLVRRVCYSGKVRFPDGINCCEDLIWCVQVLLHNPKISYLEKAFYHYIITDSEGSQSNSISKKRSLEDLKMFHVLESLLEMDDEIQKEMYRSTIPFVIKRAMKAKCFGAAYFRKNFERYVPYLFFTRRHSLLLRLTCVISALGGYGLCKPLVKFMR